LALLHSKSIAFRDLKPENLLVDKTGFIVVVDFGFAKIIGKNMKSFTLCGSAEYLAPEVVTRRGHGQSVDFWSLGIIVYEMMFGVTPFVAGSNRDIFKRILQGEVTFPIMSRMSSEHSIDVESCCDLILRLLDQTPVTRLGSLLDGVGGIVDHDFFKFFNWDALASHTMKPPFLPILKVHGVVAMLESEEDDSEDESEGGRAGSGAGGACWTMTWGTTGDEGDWKGW
jgi:serine/threonine protein kinase